VNTEHTLQCTSYNISKQVVIFDKAASPLQADDSTVFARWHQYAPQLNTWFLVPLPTQVHNLNNVSIGSAVFAGLTIMTYRHTTLVHL